MQPTSHAAMSGGRQSGPENRGLGAGWSESDDTATVFRPLGLGLDGQGAARPENRNKGSGGPLGRSIGAAAGGTLREGSSP